jgi:DegV family protein with EDD domain
MATQKIAIVTDSSAYLPADAQSGLNIHVIPVWLIWDDENYRDGVDITPETFYSRLKTSKTLPSSSQPSVMEFKQLFEEISKEAEAIVAVLVSSKLSGTVASAQSAANELPHISIEIVDSLAGSMCLGFTVLAAARAAAAGDSLEKIVAAAEQMKEETKLIFIVDTLEFLHRSGRISGGRRLLGTALQIKPILHFEEGLIRPLSQARTKRKALYKLIELAESHLAGKQMKEAAIVEIDCQEDCDKLEIMVRDRFAPADIYRTGVSPVVGTIVGPGSIGLAYHTQN